MSLSGNTAEAMIELGLLPGECWWGGAVADGQLMPYGRAEHRRDRARSAGVDGDPDADNNASGRPRPTSPPPGGRPHE